jgi:hypothetical protein
MACCPYDVHDFDLDQEIKRNFDFDQRSHQNAYSAAVAMAIRSGVPIVAVFGSHKLPEMRDVLENLIAELKKVIDPVRKPVYIYIDIDLIDGQSQPALKKYIDETIRARNNACTIVFPIEPGKYGIPEIRTVVWGGPKGLAMALRESLHQAQAKMDQGKNAFYTTYQP